ncbi:MAG: hypothetical protein IKL29_07960 [Bacteroidaceae bacterium]|nr:hypothetical protein [Bacteroidaceae bacterium]
MSVVAAKVTKDKIQMAADSILVKGWSKRNANFAKIAEINGMILGGVGIAQETSLMWHYMQTHKPASASEKDVLAFIVEFSQWKAGTTGNSQVDNCYLLAYQGHLFEIEHMFVFEIKDYVAIGAGDDFANAALYLGHTPREAVKVACELSCYVSEPIIEFEMPKAGDSNA